MTRIEKVSGQWISEEGADSEVRMQVVLVGDWQCELIVGCQFLQALNTANLYLAHH